MSVAKEVNIGFDVVPVLDGEGDYASLYTYHVHGAASAAFEDFLNAREVVEAPDYNPLLGRLGRMRDELGLYDKRIDSYPERWLRDEGEGTSALWAPIPVEVRARYPKPPPSLRLYCFRLDSHEHMTRGVRSSRAPILILGNGGIKRTQRPDDDKHASVYRSFLDIRFIRQRFDERFTEGDIWIAEDGFVLEGDLTFQASY